MNAHRIARLLYVLVFLAAAPLSADEGEPNDKREQASPAEINRAVAGSLDDRADRDWYRIDVPSAGDVYAEVITATGDYVAVDVRFYDTNGKPLGDYGLWLDAPATVFVEIVPYGDDWFPPRRLHGHVLPLQRGRRGL